MKNLISFICVIPALLVMNGCQSDQHKKAAGKTATEQPSAADASILMLSERATQLAGVETGVVTAEGRTRKRTTVGRLVAGSAAGTTLTPRFSGKIVRLFTRETGQRIHTGDPIATIYSPELSAIMGEHLLLMEQSTKSGSEETDTMVQASRQKLVRAGMTPAQVTAIERSGKVPAALIWHAEADGIILTVEAKEGGWVTAGSPALTLRVASEWLVEVGLYPSECSSLAPGQRMEIQFQSGLRTTAIVETIRPEAGNDALTRPVRLRSQRLPVGAREGDPVSVIVSSLPESSIFIPDEAIARSGEHAGVFRRIAPGTFRLQPVNTGESMNGRTSISAGLVPGDTIAVSGAWLLYAELSSRLGIRPLSEMKNQP